MRWALLGFVLAEPVALYWGIMLKVLEQGAAVG